jgi:hypothetical protein
LGRVQDVSEAPDGLRWQKGNYYWADLSAGGNAPASVLHRDTHGARKQLTISAVDTEVGSERSPGPGERLNSTKPNEKMLASISRGLIWND